MTVVCCAERRVLSPRPRRGCRRQRRHRRFRESQQKVDAAAVLSQAMTPDRFQHIQLSACASRPHSVVQSSRASPVPHVVSGDGAAVGGALAQGAVGPNFKWSTSAIEASGEDFLLPPADTHKSRPNPRMNVRSSAIEWQPERTGSSVCSSVAMVLHSSVDRGRLKIQNLKSCLEFSIRRLRVRSCCRPFWICWRLFAVEAGQDRRRKVRHARGFHHRSLLRAWRRVVVVEARCEQQVECTRPSESEVRTMRYVCDQMLHMRAAALLQHHAMRATARTVWACFLSWRQAVASFRAQWQAVSRAESQLLVKAFSAFSACMMQGRRVGHLQRHVVSRGQLQLLKTSFFTWGCMMSLRRAFCNLRQRHRRAAQRRGIIAFRSKALAVAACKEFSRRASSFEGRNKLRRGILALQQTAIVRRALGAQIAQVAMVEKRIRQRHALSKMRRQMVLRSAASEVARFHAWWRVHSALRRLQLNVVVAKRAHDVSIAHQIHCSRRATRCWALAATIWQRFRALDVQAVCHLKSLVHFWLFGCPLLSVFDMWRQGAAVLQKENRADRCRQAALFKYAQCLCIRWHGIVKRTKLACLRLSQKIIVKSTARAIHAWRDLTMLLQVARLEGARRESDRFCMLLRAWRVAAWSCKKYSWMVRSQFIAWRCLSEASRARRDAVQRERWAESVAEEFSLARLLTLCQVLYAAWASRAGTINAFRSRVFRRYRTCLCTQVFAVLKKWFALVKFKGADAILFTWRVCTTLWRWRNKCRGLEVASCLYHARRARLLRDIRLIAHRRRACARLARTLTMQCCARAWEKILMHNVGLLAAEKRAEQVAARNVKRDALDVWRSWCQYMARRASLPHVLHAWRWAVRMVRLARRSARAFGLRRWHAFARCRWATRRRLAIADLLSVRRRRRGFFLRWQLHCFLAKGTGRMSRLETDMVAEAEALEDRWSDAVAVPDAVRPLMMLCAPPAGIHSPTNMRG